MTQAILELDKTGAEWVVVAYLTGCSRMLLVVERMETEGVSPHVITGNFITGVPEDLIEKESAVLKHATDPDLINQLRREHLPELFQLPGVFLPRVFSIRQCGKKSNHGLNYDMGYRRFALENEMPEKESYRIVYLYRTEAYPGLPLWHESIDDQLRRDRTLYNCFGRKRVFLDQWGDDLKRAAYAFIPQSTVFDNCRIGWVKAYNDETKIFRPLHLLMQVHDSIVCQYPINDWSAMAAMVIKFGFDYMRPTMEYNARQFKLETSCKIGPSRGHTSELTVVEDHQKMTESLREAYESACAKAAA